MRVSKAKKCANCGINKAIKHTSYGYIFCNTCQKDTLTPHRYVEFTTDHIREQRGEYSKDILQPWVGDTLSQEYLEEYGTAGVKATDKQIKNARYTNKGTKNWWNRDKSKGGRSWGEKYKK